ncbi:MAG TPA: hypothetical protein PLY58_03740 [Bacilli bacterium]|nr:hypothetical protein [Bacilli bacterium]HQA56167.1 hypothetical protein [Bacilli bacterium]
MKIKEAFSRSQKIYSAHPLNSWVLGVACAIFLAAICGFDLAFPGLDIIVIPLFGIPFVFATIISHFQLRMNNEVRTRSFFRLFAVYFTRPFRSSFQVLFSFFKSIIAFFLATGLLFGITYLIFANNFGSAFTTNINGFFNVFSNPGAYENTDTYNAALQVFLQANGDMLYIFFDIVFVPPVFISALVFIYFVSVESISIFARLYFPQNPSPMIRSAVKQSMKRQRKSFYSAYFGMNWPIFALFVTGAIGGFFASFYLTGDSSFSSSIGLMGGLVLMAFYAPFYLANMEIIYSILEGNIRLISKEMTQQILINIQNQRQLSEQEAEMLSKALEDLDKLDQDNNLDNPDDSNEKSNDKDKEKDPTNGPE